VDEERLPEGPRGVSDEERPVRDRKRESNSPATVVLDALEVLIDDLVVDPWPDRTTVSKRSCLSPWERRVVV
jgi:hypothetical protein